MENSLLYESWVCRRGIGWHASKAVRQSSSRWRLIHNTGIFNRFFTRCHIKQESSICLLIVWEKSNTCKFLPMDRTFLKCTNLSVCDQTMNYSKVQKIFLSGKMFGCKASLSFQAKCILPIEFIELRRKKSITVRSISWFPEWAFQKFNQMRENEKGKGSKPP